MKTVEIRFVRNKATAGVTRTVPGTVTRRRQRGRQFKLLGPRAGPLALKSNDDRGRDRPRPVIPGESLPSGTETVTRLAGLWPPGGRGTDVTHWQDFISKVGACAYYAYNFHAFIFCIFMHIFRMFWHIYAIEVNSLYLAYYAYLEMHICAYSVLHISTYFLHIYPVYLHTNAYLGFAYFCIY